MKLRKRLEHFLKYVDESTYWKEDNDVPNHVIVRAYLEKFKPNGQLPGIVSKRPLDETYLYDKLEGYINLRDKYKTESQPYGCYDLLVREFTQLLELSQACDSEKGGEKSVSVDCVCVIPNPDKQDKCFKCGGQIYYKRA